MSVVKKDEQISKIEDPYYRSFHGFDRLEREFRGDGWYYGRASDYVACREQLISERPRNCLVNPVSGCFIGGPLRSIILFRDAVAILHGPAGCGNYEYVECSVLKPYDNLVCTQMNEQDALLGGEERLQAAIREVVERFRPGMIGVIGTCTSAINGDDIEGICQSLEEEMGIPIMGFPASGFRHRTWNLGSEESFNRLIDRMRPATPEEVNRGSINFINFPVLPRHWIEILHLLPYLQRLGIRLNAHVPASSTFAEFLERFPRAELNVMRCTGVGMILAEYAEKQLGIPYLRIPKPVSLAYTERFLRELAAFFGRQEAAEALIREERERIGPRLERVRAKLSGKRIAITCGSGKNIALAQLATELGMEVVYLSPWKVDPLYHELLEEWTEQSGQDPEVMAEGSVYEHEAILSRLRPDLFVGIAEEIPFVARLGIPALEFMYLPAQLCGFEGVVQVGEWLVQGLANRLLHRYGRELWDGLPLYSSPQFLQESELARKPCARKLAKR